MADDSLDAAYFEGIFASDDDPWSLASSEYEREKHDTTIAALDGRHFDDLLEVGCAHGVLTRRLAPSCTRLNAIDISESALIQARRRCTEMPQVDFSRCAFPQETPALGEIDGVVLSEVVYYWSDADIGRAGEWLAAHVACGGDVLLVHYTGETDYPQSGDDAAAKMRLALGDDFARAYATRHVRYRLDLWRRR